MAELVQGQSAPPVGIKSEGFADALHHRVRQIAAKIDGIPHLNNSGSLVDPSVYGYGVQKRPLDNGEIVFHGVEEYKWILDKLTKWDSLNQFVVGNQLGALVHQRETLQPNTLRDYFQKTVATSTSLVQTERLRTVMTEEFKVPDKMVGFIIGRGGEQISRIQSESGCKIQIAPDSGGMPDRPCVLTGAPESIEQAKRLLGQIVDRCRNGPGFHNDLDGNSTIQEILIPASKVGLVIGKGGETIKQLQERAGVKMIMIQDGPLPTGADKPLRITGDPFKVQQARELVVEIIREKDQADFRGLRNDFSSRMGGGSIEVSVPRFAVGIVIGRNGEMIKKIQNDAGVRIQFKPDDGISPERVAQVMGLPDRCQHAAHIINELIVTAQERDGFGALAMARGRGRNREWNIGTSGGMQEITYTVPADKCGLVIGKGGENIKSINQQSGAHVELQRNPPPNTDPSVRIFTIRGIPQQIEMARHLIDEKVGVRKLCATKEFFEGLIPERLAHYNKLGKLFATKEYIEGLLLENCGHINKPGTNRKPEGTSISAASSYGQSPFSQPHATPHQNGPQAFLTQGWGSTYQAWQQPAQQLPGQQSQQQNAQPDYSKAWEEYFKKQTQAASATSQPSSQPDYTMAWAEYYRQQAAYYGQSLAQTQGHSQEQ